MYFLRLKRELAWDRWANEQFLRFLSDNPDSPERSVSLIGHIVATEWLWLGRIGVAERAVTPWPGLNVEQTASLAGDLVDVWNSFLEKVTSEELARVVTYVNSKGEKFSSSVLDILTHVVTHSAYHRGQIATDLVAAGKKPPYTDYIHATRNGFIE